MTSISEANDTPSFNYLVKCVKCGEPRFLKQFIDDTRICSRCNESAKSHRQHLWMDHQLIALPEECIKELLRLANVKVNERTIKRANDIALLFSQYTLCSLIFSLTSRYEYEIWTIHSPYVHIALDYFADKFTEMNDTQHTLNLMLGEDDDESADSSWEPEDEEHSDDDDDDNDNELVLIRSIGEYGWRDTDDLEDSSDDESSEDDESMFISESLRGIISNDSFHKLFGHHDIKHLSDDEFEYILRHFLRHYKSEHDMRGNTVNLLKNAMYAFVVSFLTHCKDGSDAANSQKHFFWIKYMHVSPASGHFDHFPELQVSNISHLLMSILPREVDEKDIKSNFDPPVNDNARESKNESTLTSQVGKMGTASPSMDDSTGISLSNNKEEDGGGGVGAEEVNSSIDQGSDNAAESSFTEFEPQVDEADTNSHKAAPSVVTSQSGVKSEDADGDSVATDPLGNEEVVPMEMKSVMNIKAEGEDTDDDELKPSAVASDMHIKAEQEGEETDEDIDFKPSAVTSVNVKMEGEDTDDESKMQPVTSGNGIKLEGDSAYGYDTDNDEPDKPTPLSVTSQSNIKAEDTDTDSVATEPTVNEEELKQSSANVKGGDVGKAAAHNGKIVRLAQAPNVSVRVTI